jgi:hypothetical protein
MFVYRYFVIFFYLRHRQPILFLIQDIVFLRHTAWKSEAELLHYSSRKKGGAFFLQKENSRFKNDINSSSPNESREAYCSML